MQKNLGPWGELATDSVILTVPTKSLKNLEDPAPLLQLWDEIMKAVAKLAAQPFPFERPERIVTDVQISSGECSRGVLLVSEAHFVITLSFLYFLRVLNHNYVVNVLAGSIKSWTMMQVKDIYK